MAQTPEDPTARPEGAPAQTAPAQAPLPKPHRGVKDAGHVVSSIADEPIAGVIADITDGDRR
jgi:hypothetical protein